MKYREFSKVSILIITNTKTRHITKAVTLKNTLQIISERVDSVFALCGSHCSPYMRYLKLLKGRNSAFNLNKVDVLWVGPPDENKGVFDLRFYEESTEENHLPLSKEKLRQQRMQAAEQLRYDGMTYQQIAEHFNMPESTVRNWVKHIQPNQEDVSDEEYIEGKVQSLRRRIEENLRLVNPAPVPPDATLVYNHNHEKDEGTTVN